MIFDWSKELPVNGKLDLLKGVYNRIQKDHGLQGGFKLSTHVDAPAVRDLVLLLLLLLPSLVCLQKCCGFAFGEYDMAHYAYDIERKDLKLSRWQTRSICGNFWWRKLYGVL
jgi:D-glycero-alpha-D-manno-heptose-7-phosphate kinase